MDTAPKHSVSSTGLASSKPGAVGPGSSWKAHEQGSFSQFDWDTASKSKGKEDPVTAGKNKQGMGSKDGETPKEISDVENPIQERKLYLQEECRILTEHLDTYLGRAEQLLHENKCLEKEAKATQEQSQVYLSCRAKCSQDPQDMVITLNDRNCRDLAQIQLQKEELIPQYAEKEKEVRASLKDTVAEASLLDAELEELEPCRDQSVQAEQSVKRLEKELRVTRIWCAEETHNIKRRFLQDKADCEHEFHQRMQELTWRAEEVALQALIQHVEQVKAENRRLRQELLGLLQHCQVLRDAKVRLQDQQEQLLRENQCAQRAALVTPARGPWRRRDNLPRSAH